MEPQRELDTDIFADEAVSAPPQTTQTTMQAATAAIAESVTAALTNLKMVDVTTKLHLEDVQLFVVDRRKKLLRDGGFTSTYSA